ncbi:aldehyde dehydrogenase family protein [Halalkalibacter nanhaiisediminis]|uniref:3-sulfolactaldehyde dehydrogenase n=1 Tax=Halalkalibacter nanhaiisediminis TaxID=688079 RepID=A0A562QPZ8_9BACI|nr:aldehyde dehydrogenase family protein [Halalkalibacter nanhaiisediminis]TWI58146.1 aldehyde dehydrogenase (NAD+) [Halalkalibacter nanhaiisediminis]
MAKVSTVKYPQWSKLPIGGVWKEGSSTQYETVKNPYNEEVLAEIKLANKSDIDEAYNKAKEAQAKWAKVSAYEKASLLEKVAELIEERRQEIVTMLVEESGSSIVKANVEVDASIGDTKEAAKYPFKMEGTIHSSLIPGKENRVYRNPIGVIGAITPWNWPFYLTIRVVAPAIATGNSIVLKADSQTPITGGLMIAKIFEDAGLPQGLINVIVADVSEIGDSMVDHPIPRVISFTGSTAAGKRIGAVAGQNLKKVALELGGNNVMIVLDDADVDQAVSAAAFGKFFHQGQICLSANRIMVDRKIYPAFVEKFKEVTSTIKVGNPAEDGNIIGPLINEKQVDRIVKFVEQSVSEGATVEIEGKVEGKLMSPFVLSNVTNDMAVAQNELFGPVAAIMPIDGEEEAIRIANASNFGLSGSVFSGSLERGIKVAHEIETGMIHVNDQTVNVEPNMPFGGEKLSGIGRYCGEEALEEFTTVKWMSVQNDPRQYPFS